MLNVSIDSEQGIVVLEPVGQLSVGDFLAVAKIIDPYIDSHSNDNQLLKGVLIHAKSFPGWDSFAALVEHIRFVRQHHEKVQRVAFVTDSALGELGQKIANHFVSAEVKQFDFNNMQTAKLWLAADSP